MLGFMMDTALQKLFFQLIIEGTGKIVFYNADKKQKIME
jgi:hypothetical protein